MAAWCLAGGAALAQVMPVTITDQNASLKYSIDVPGAPLQQPNDPVQLPRKLEWTVDGRRVLVYPSGTSGMLDIGHLHLGAHVATNQMHAQGPLIGFGTGGTTGSVVGGVVYSVHGGAAGSGSSRITEKLDLHNKTSAPLSITLTGMGFKSPQAALEVPDLSGLKVTGTTVVYFQGNAQATSLTEPPFAPISVLPVVSFVGFNPLLNQPFNLPAGAQLTMVTELKVEREPLIAELVPWLLFVLIVVLPAAAWRAQRRRRG
jgi:hypothetical protein